MDNLRSFQQLKNIDKQYKINSIEKRASLFLATLSILASFGYGIYINQEAKKTIYIRENEGVYTAFLKKQIYENRDVEIKSQLKIIHEYMFNLDPDPMAIKESMDNASLLGDKSIVNIDLIRKEQINNEPSYYSKLIANNVSTRVKIDSVKILKNKDPYKAIVYAKEIRIRPSKNEIRNLITSCNLRDVKRSSNNPHGLFVESFNIIQNELIKFDKRKTIFND